MKCLTRAAEIVREDMFKSGDLFNGSFSQGCQESSVSPSLLTLVDMILQGTNETFHYHGNHQAALTVSQLLKFNSVKHGWKSTDGSVQHNKSQETPLPLYLGILIHAKTRKKGITVEPLLSGHPSLSGHFLKSQIILVSLNCSIRYLY